MKSLSSTREKMRTRMHPLTWVNNNTQVHLVRLYKVNVLNLRSLASPSKSMRMHTRTLIRNILRPREVFVNNNRAWVCSCSFLSQMCSLQLGFIFSSLYNDWVRLTNSFFLFYICISTNYFRTYLIKSPTIFYCTCPFLSI